MVDWVQKCQDLETRLKAALDEISKLKERNRAEVR